MKPNRHSEYITQKMRKTSVLVDIEDEIDHLLRYASSQRSPEDFSDLKNQQNISQSINSFLKWVHLSDTVCHSNV